MSDVDGMKRVLMLLPFCAALSGCRQDMHDQPRYDPLQESTFFSDGRSARPYIEGTVARGHLNSDAVLYTGKRGDQFVDTFHFR